MKIPFRFQCSFSEKHALVEVISDGVMHPRDMLLVLLEGVVSLLKKNLDCQIELPDSIEQEERKSSRKLDA